jgi:hypothetical protein
MILGTRMYYPFFDTPALAIVDEDDAAFEKRIDAVVRDIGNRGKRTDQLAGRSSEASGSQALAKPQGISAAVAPAAPPRQAESAVSSSSSSSAPARAGGGGSFAEMSAFFQRIEDKRQRERDETKADMEKMRLALMARPPPPRELISQTQLAALHVRLEGLRVQGTPGESAQLLTESEMHCLEDAVADYITLRSTVPVVTADMLQASPTALKIAQLVALSEQLTADRPFARQALRLLSRG